MNITVFDDAEGVSTALALAILDALQSKPDVVLGLATGRTPVDAYAYLRGWHATGRGNWDRVSTFNLDEFVGVDALHPGSFRQFMQRHLFNGVNIVPSRIHFLNGVAPDLDAECVRYEREISEAGGIDLQVLGIGRNGHIGFNEPAETFIARTHRVTLLDSTQRDNAPLFDDDVARVPTDALTMGIDTILQTRRIALVATGARKAESIARMINGPLDPLFPASMLQRHVAVDVLLDQQAASKI